jgi:hypothetical protein
MSRHLRNSTVVQNHGRPPQAESVPVKERRVIRIPSAWCERNGPPEVKRMVRKTEEGQVEPRGYHRGTLF